MTQIITCREGKWRSTDASNTHPHLPARTYTLNMDMEGFFLTESDPFELPSKLYGGVQGQAERIFRTFLDRPFITGVLLEGEKGSGKTLLAKQVSLLGLAVGMPTILVSSPFHGEQFNAFMQQLHQPCIVLFDEFEKVYCDRSDQQELLTFLDGTVPTKKLCILTVNDSWGLDRNLINRPGRLFYSLSFAALSAEFIREYATDRLADKTHIEGVVRVATGFTRFNFDQLQALVEEMNRYGEGPLPALRWLNIKPSFDGDKTFIAAVTNPKGRAVKMHTSQWAGNPLLRDQDLTFYYTVVRGKSRGAETKQLEFTEDDLVQALRGQFIFRNPEGYTLTLIPKPPSKMDVFGYADLA